MKKVLLILIIIFIGLLGLIYYYRDDIVLSNKKEKDKVTSTTTSVTTEPIKKDEVNITIVGDLLFEQPLYDDNEDIEKTNYFDLVKPYFLNDDLTIANLEVPISDGNLKVSGVGYSFCAPISVGKLITTLGFEVLSTANNHSYDRGIEGINSTINFFKNNSNIVTVGTNDNDNENTNTIKYKEINNIKMSFISYTYGTNVKIDANNRFRVNLFRNPDTKSTNEEELNRIKKDIENARMNSDVIIVMMHWGKEFTLKQNDEQERMAKYLNELGVDIIIGNHSHSIQPISFIGEEHKTLVYYSLGNFVSADHIVDRVGEKFRNAYQFGILSTLKLTKDNNKVSITDVKTEPIINYYDTNLNNFKLIPLSKYDETLEKTHYLYKKNFTKDFVLKTYNDVIAKEFQ